MPGSEYYDDDVDDEDWRRKDYNYELEIRNKVMSYVYPVHSFGGVQNDLVYILTNIILDLKRGHL